MQTQPDEVRVPMDLALRLTGWHSSMHDPIYAVSSSGIAKHPVPREIFDAALLRIQQDAASPTHIEEHAEELEEIRNQMQAVIGKIEIDKVRDCIARAMARSYWAMAWADEAEKHDVNLGGCQLLHVAPETPKRALAAAYADIEALEKHFDKTIADLYEPYKDFNPYDFGHELAMSVSGAGGDLDIETHYSEVNYYDFADEWIAE